MLRKGIKSLISLFLHFGPGGVSKEHISRIVETTVDPMSVYREHCTFGCVPNLKITHFGNESRFVQIVSSSWQRERNRHTSRCRKGLFLIASRSITCVNFLKQNSKFSNKSVHSHSQYSLQFAKWLGNHVSPQPQDDLKLKTLFYLKKTTKREFRLHLIECRFIKGLR